MVAVRRRIVLAAVTGIAGLAAIPGLVPSAHARASARAAGRCVPAHTGKLVPRVVDPCDGATVARGLAVSFAVVDPDAQASIHAPYLDVSTTRTLDDGHLVADRSGNGVFAQMTADSARARTFTFTSPRESYASWWDNHAGTVYVQVEQVDPRASSGIVYGPITTLRVP